ncbi:hypothetical protein [Geodermatophilus amargosae]|uniref:hypothetical protein n=1 Tax=Geodermatophilus amargosae TaxID=1296565 RepID=UPI0034DF2D1A
MVLPEPPLEEPPLEEPPEELADELPEERELAALRRLRRAAQRQQAAEREVVEAMREGRELGLSLARIGSALGVSAQAVRQRLMRN